VCGKGSIQLPDRDEQTLRSFERTVLPHLDAAYNLARWLTRDEHDARDAVQEAFLRAYRFYENFHGGDARAWLLAIVRNTCHTLIASRRAHGRTMTIEGSMPELARNNDDDRPEAAMMRDDNVRLVRGAIDELPEEFREAIVLRELEGLSYKQIAEVAHVRIGTVMSRLARARERLTECLSRRLAVHDTAGGGR
jgi:RNA polymerase sigma factor (sigma-70 family)